VRFGERWLTQGRTAALSVPSAVIPQERNFIINPSHDDFGMIQVGRPENFSFDPRMWKRGA
jgi:RES domain-containing protein